MGESGCCSRPPSCSEPVSRAAKPISSIRRATTAVAPASGQMNVINGIEGLHQTGTGKAVQHNLRRRGAAQIVKTAIRTVRVHGVDDDLIAQQLWLRQRLRRAPRDRQQDHFAKTHRVADGHGMRLRPEFRDQFAQRIRPARVADCHVMSGSHKQPGSRCADIARSQDPNLHAALPLKFYLLWLPRLRAKLFAPRFTVLKFFSWQYYTDAYNRDNLVRPCGENNCVSVA